MRLFLTLFTLIALSSLQLQAASCELNCEMSKVSLSHKCCDSGPAFKSSDSDHCKGSVKNTCFHKLNIHKSNFSKEFRLELTHLSFVFVKPEFEHERLRLSRKILGAIPPNSERNFIRFKSQRKIHILHESLLI